MYEETETPTFRRTIMLIVTVIAIAVVLWLGAWFFFLRGHSVKTGNTSSGSKTKQQTSQSAPKGSNNHSSTPNTVTAGGSTSNQSSGTAAATNPDQLANAGAGSVLAPVLGGVIGGVVIYQIYLRRRTLPSDA
jgi:cytoskeletal protein RodZ